MAKTLCSKCRGPRFDPLVKNLPAMQETQVRPGSGRSSGEWNGNPLQYSSLENPIHRGAWWAIVRGVAKS